MATAPKQFSTKIGNDTFSLTRLHSMKAVALFPLFAPVAGRMAARVLGLLKELGVVSADAKAVTWGDIGALFDDDQKLMAFLMKHAEQLLTDLGDMIAVLKTDSLYRLQWELFRSGSLLRNGVPMFPGEDDKRFDDVFGGDPIRVFRLLMFALQVNYAGFSLAVVPEAGSSQPAPVAAADPSQESTT